MIQEAVEMEGEGWKRDRYLNCVFEEYVYNSMYDLTNHDPVLYLNDGTKMLLIYDPILSDVQLSIRPVNQRLEISEEQKLEFHRTEQQRPESELYIKVGLV